MLEKAQAAPLKFWTILTLATVLSLSVGTIPGLCKAQFTTRAILEDYIQELQQNPYIISEKEVVVMLRIPSIKDVLVEIPIDITILDKASNEIVFDQIVIFSSNPNADKEIFLSSKINLESNNKVYDILVSASKFQATRFPSNVAQNGLFDLSFKPLLAGDLSISAGLQDNLVDQVDYDILIQRISSNTPEDLEIADLDFNGIINSYDRSLLIKAILKN